MRRAAQGGMVDSVTESLPMLIARRMADLEVDSLSALHRRLPADDGRVTYETVRNLANGKQRTVREDRVLNALADMLDVEVNAVRAALQMEPDYGEWQLPDRAQGLDPQERQVVVSVIDALLRAKRTGGQKDAGDAEAEKTSNEGVRPNVTQGGQRLAARRGASHGKRQANFTDQLGQESQDDGGWEPA